MFGTELANQIETKIKAIFPNSGVRCKLETNLGTYICLQFALGKKEDWANGIIHNDPCHSLFFIHDVSNDKLPEKIVFNSDYNSVWTGNERIKPGFRKITSSPEQMATKVEKYFLKLRQVLKDNVDKFNKENYKKIIENL